jgi:hypothetical protein
MLLDRTGKKRLREIASEGTDPGDIELTTPDAPPNDPGYK